MKLRVGIVGCGKFADVHIQQVQVLDNAEVVAVCDLEPLMAQQMAVRYSLPAMYSDLGRMLTRTEHALFCQVRTGSNLSRLQPALEGGYLSLA